MSGYEPQAFTCAQWTELYALFLVAGLWLFNLAILGLIKVWVWLHGQGEALG
jgi:hypothetical protein